MTRKSKRRFDPRQAESTPPTRKQARASSNTATVTAVSGVRSRRTDDDTESSAAGTSFLQESSLLRIPRLPIALRKSSSCTESRTQRTHVSSGAWEQELKESTVVSLQQPPAQLFSVDYLGKYLEDLPPHCVQAEHYVREVWSKPNVGNSPRDVHVIRQQRLDDDRRPSIWDPPPLSLNSNNEAYVEIDNPGRMRDFFAVKIFSFRYDPKYSAMDILRTLGMKPRHMFDGPLIEGMLKDKKNDRNAERRCCVIFFPSTMTLRSLQYMVHPKKRLLTVPPNFPDELKLTSFKSLGVKILYPWNREHPCNVHHIPLAVPKRKFERKEFSERCEQKQSTAEHSQKLLDLENQMKVLSEKFARMKDVVYTRDIHLPAEMTLVKDQVGIIKRDLREVKEKAESKGMHQSACEKVSEEFASCTDSDYYSNFDSTANMCSSDESDFGGCVGGQY